MQESVIQRMIGREERKKADRNARRQAGTREGKKA